MFSAVWYTAPILISVLSFFVYVSNGHELTVSKAFTAIALFGMIRQPLSVIPYVDIQPLACTFLTSIMSILLSLRSWIVKILQALVAVRRIEAFLNEEEVGPQVSTLKEDTSREFSEITVLGLENAFLKRNSAEKNESSEVLNSKGTDNGTRKTGNMQNDIEAGVLDSAQSDISQAETESVQQDHVFELCDISVVFPDGALSVVVGPTASGKTSLLVSPISLCLARLLSNSISLQSARFTG